jgi:MarR family transcriptional regulator, organic hydroperoxide resistance regulator
MPAKQKEISGIAHKLFFRLYQTMNLCLRKANTVLTEINMSPQQWSILDSLSRPGLEEGMTVNGLVAYLMVSRQSLNGVLKRMEEAQYIERTVNPADQRSRKVRLTEKGRIVWASAGLEMKKFYDYGLSHMTEQDKLDTIAIMEQIQANVRDYPKFD